MPAPATARATSSQAWRPGVRAAVASRTAPAWTASAATSSSRLRTRSTRAPAGAASSTTGAISAANAAATHPDPSGRRWMRTATAVRADPAIDTRPPPSSSARSRPAARCVMGGSAAPTRPGAPDVRRARPVVHRRGARHVVHSPGAAPTDDLGTFLESGPCGSSTPPTGTWAARSIGSACSTPRRRSSTTWSRWCAPSGWTSSWSPVTSTTGRCRRVDAVAPAPTRRWPGSPRRRRRGRAHQRATTTPPGRLGFAARLIDAAGVHLRTDPASVRRPGAARGRARRRGGLRLPYLEPRRSHGPPGRWPGAGHEAALAAAMRRRPRRPGDATRRHPVGGRSPTRSSPAASRATASATSASAASRRAGRRSSTASTTWRSATCTAAQPLGETVRYSGSPLAYSFSEAAPRQGLAGWSTSGRRASSACDVRRGAGAPPAGRAHAAPSTTLLTDPRARPRTRTPGARSTLTDDERPGRRHGRGCARASRTPSSCASTRPGPSAGTYTRRIAEQDDLGLCCGFVEHVRSGRPATPSVSCSRRRSRARGSPWRARAGSHRCGPAAPLRRQPAAGAAARAERERVAG